MTQGEKKTDGRTHRHRHRRPELVAAAVEYVLEHGISDLSLRPFAKELGITHATLLRHFGSKEAMVIEVVNRIREELLDELARPGPDHPGSGPPRPIAPGEAMWAAWSRLTQPQERRQFVLLFELVALHDRHPDRFGSLAPMLVADFLGPIRLGLESYGLHGDVAGEIATGFLAQVRGLQLDLAVSKDQDRVDAAMRRYIDSLAPAT